MGLFGVGGRGGKTGLFIEIFLASANNWDRRIEHPVYSSSLNGSLLSSIEPRSRECSYCTIGLLERQQIELILQADGEDVLNVGIRTTCNSPSWRFQKTSLQNRTWGKRRPPLYLQSPALGSEQREMRTAPPQMFQKLLRAHSLRQPRMSLIQRPGWRETVENKGQLRLSGTVRWVDGSQ